MIVTGAARWLRRWQAAGCRVATGLPRCAYCFALVDDVVRAALFHVKHWPGGWSLWQGQVGRLARSRHGAAWCRECGLPNVDGKSLSDTGLCRECGPFLMADNARRLAEPGSVLAKEHLSMRTYCHQGAPKICTPPAGWIPPSD